MKVIESVRRVSKDFSDMALGQQFTIPSGSGANLLIIGSRFRNKWDIYVNGSSSHNHIIGSKATHSQKSFQKHVLNFNLGTKPAKETTPTISHSFIFAWDVSGNFQSSVYQDATFTFLPSDKSPRKMQGLSTEEMVKYVQEICTDNRLTAKGQEKARETLAQIQAANAGRLPQYLFK